MFTFQFHIIDCMEYVTHYKLLGNFVSHTHLYYFYTFVKNCTVTNILCGKLITPLVNGRSSNCRMLPSKTDINFIASVEVRCKMNPYKHGQLCNISEINNIRNSF